MPKTKTRTIVYQYGAVPLDPFPKEAVEQLYRANALWNTLVEHHRDSQDEYEAALRGADGEYADIADQLTDLEEKISAAFDEKRTARMHAQSRSGKHPLIAKANERIDELKSQQRELWKLQREPRKRASEGIDRKKLNSAFNENLKQAQRIRNTGGLDNQTANEVARNFKEARQEYFKDPSRRLRFHRFDGTGYRFYRFREKDANADGVRLNYLFSKGADDGRPFTLSDNGKRGGKPRLKLRLKVAGGAPHASKVFMHFDLVYHRPIPEGAQINNAKLVVRRTGDRFKYTINFSVREPITGVSREHKAAIGIDVGFRRMPDGAIRGATVCSSDGSVPMHVVGVEPELMKRVFHYQQLQSELSDTAAELGKKLKPLLKGGSILDEDHKQYKTVFSLASLPSNRTFPFEKAYKLARWFEMRDETLPAQPQKLLSEWYRLNGRKYREMHNLRKKTLAARKESYRIFARKLIAHRLPIAIEQINLSVFAEVKDKDTELSETALSQRFLVSNSELVGAITNAAQREGVKIVKINPRNTSKTCSECGAVNTELKAELSWSCSSCGVLHDRDENAAKNIARLALEKL